MIFSRTKQRTSRTPVAESNEYQFRRSRTITGSTSTTIQQTAGQHSQLQTPRQRLQELRRRRKRIVSLLVSIIAAGILIFLLILNYAGDLHVLLGQQTSRVQPPVDSYAATLQDYFKQFPLQRFSIFANAAALEQYMKTAHSEIAAFSETHNWYGGDTHFVVYFRRPILTWQSAANHFYVDAQGTAFTYDHFGSSVVAVDDQSGITAEAGGSVASGRFIKFLGTLVGALNAGGKGQVSSIIIPPSTREVDVKLQGRGYIIRAHSDRDSLGQAQDILSALGYFDGHHITPQYIDARVDGRVFYK